MSKYKAVYDREGLKAEYSDGVCTFYRGEPDDVTVPHYQYMPDIQPYQSMIDGHMVTSRSEHRTHLRDHNCFEVGNETMTSRSAPPRQDQRREFLHRQLGDMSDRQANKLLKEIRRDYGR